MKRLFLVCCAAAAMVGCQKESSMDSALTKDKEMTFAPYAGASATRGTAINKNEEMASVNGKAGAFEVAAYSESVPYFGFNTVTHNGSGWVNTDKMYWPNKNSELHFGAFFPSSAKFTTAPAYSYSGAHDLTFSYNVEDNVSDQVDLMYALSDYSYEVSTTDTDPAKAGLHFKHALSQINFTATKQDDIAVTVKSLKLCNIGKGGDFEADKATDKDAANGDITEDQPHLSVNKGNFCIWKNVDAALQNYAAKMNFGAGKDTIAIAAGAKVTQLTSLTDVMMLVPQSLTAWNPKAEGVDPRVDKGAYLAIECVITHDDGEAPIVDGFIYVPFDTKQVVYTTGDADMWKAGYKITYNLHFGGGYTGPGPGPGPGETPDPDDVIPTLREITYKVTVDEWMPATGGPVDME